MKTRELINLLMSQAHDADVRIGDQVESGPYLHASVGGVWRNGSGDVILTANDDKVWKDESAGGEVEVIWQP